MGGSAALLDRTGTSTPLKKRLQDSSMSVALHFGEGSVQVPTYNVKQPCHRLHKTIPANGGEKGTEECERRVAVYLGILHYVGNDTETSVRKRAVVLLWST
jgi:hypothetical protein